ncbi:hypothetical protein BDR04DRAFT_1113147 [Suillus decipiens]|nr:hypothetical protein BDR04DRAFT_1113147 [Suillus decipiens]
MKMRRRDRPTASKVTSTGSVTRRQATQHRGRAINKDRELERERDVGGKGFDDLIHQQDSETIVRFKQVLNGKKSAASEILLLKLVLINKNMQNHGTSTRCEPSVEGRTAHVIAAPRGTCGNAVPDDYVKDFLSSLRPNLEPKIQQFKRIGLDSKTTLDAFIRWQASEREGWIFSQNLYLQLTPLELSGLMYREIVGWE